MTRENLRKIYSKRRQQSDKLGKNETDAIVSDLCHICQIALSPCYAFLRFFVSPCFGTKTCEHWFKDKNHLWDQKSVSESLHTHHPLVSLLQKPSIDFKFYSIDNHWSFLFFQSLAATSFKVYLTVLSKKLFLF